MADNDNLFSDATETQPEYVEAPAEEQTEVVEQSGEEAGTPPVEEEEQSSEKMIPEHRFKAALNAVNKQLEDANRELANLKALPVPDRAEDPEGYDLHIRMETSKTLMREMKPDYDEVIAHYVQMAQANPYLNQAVADNPIPAKYAYDVAKKDMEIRELSGLKESEEWKAFQAFKASQKEAPIGKKLANVPSSVPNLNRATNVTKPSQAPQDDDLFVGAL